MHIMIDLETLGTRPDAAIVQVAAVPFEARSGGRVLNDKAFDRLVNADSCTAVGMTIDHATVAWWATDPKNADARARVFSTPKPDEPSRFLPDVLTSLAIWGETTIEGGWAAVEGVWSHGATFDLPILHTAYSRFGMLPPWSFRLGRDTRTLFMLSGGMPEVDLTGLKMHDAVDDCVYQAMSVQKAFGILGR